MQLDPTCAIAWACLGMALHHQGQPDEAIAAYRHALAFDPGLLEALNNLGILYTERREFAQAITCFDRALVVDASCATASKNKAVAQLHSGALDAALATYGEAIAQAPDDPDLHQQLGSLHLLRGDFEAGWREYAWRLKLPDQLPPVPLPTWDGSSLSGKRILLRPEQGIGDTVQFVRYAPILRSQAAAVYLECPARFVNLFSRCPGIDRIVSYEEPLPPADFAVPLLSVPGILGTRLGNIPSQVPYLFADERLVAAWREKLSPQQGLRIGINWRGRPGPIESTRRDLPLAHFIELSRLADLCLVSLQQGAGREDLRAAAPGHRIVDLGEQVDAQHGAFSDTAAIMKCLDLVITSDTSVAHVAGALGVPVWVALPTIPDWRWLLDRADSPWYPTMRLFRQQQPGNWDDFFAQIASQLAFISATRASSAH